MPVEIRHMRELMMPGLLAARSTYSYLAPQWSEVFAEEVAVLPSLGLPTALALGAAAVIIQNPEVSRRGLFSWTNA